MPGATPAIFFQGSGAAALLRLLAERSIT